MSVIDSAMTREIMRDISRRPLDTSQLAVHVMHGVVYMQGRIEKLGGEHQNVDLHEEINIIVRMLKLKPGIRDVCCEVDLGGLTLIDKAQEKKKRIRN